MENFKSESIERIVRFVKDKARHLKQATLIGAIVATSATSPDNTYAASPTSTESEKVSKQEQVGERYTNPHLESHIDQNMPDGIVRDFVYVQESQYPVASFFRLDQNKVEAHLLSNDQHSSSFSPELRYDILNKELENENQEIAIAFAGPYKTSSGNIEGVAIEDGVMVGENSFSKWHGFLYITPEGKMEMYRLRDNSNNFQKDKAHQLVERAQKEGGSVFQQIPAIWEGEQKLFSSSTSKFEWRAIIQTKDGSKAVINVHEKMTQEEFLNMCIELKDQQGNRLVDNLLLTDTGVYSDGVFRDKKQIKDNTQFGAYSMKDEQYPNLKGYTNVVAITVEKQ